MVLSKMSEAQLKTGHFGCYFMRFRFLFKLCVLLGLSVGADGPPHHRRAEVWELTRPPLQEGASQLLGVGGGSLHSRREHLNCWGWEAASTPLVMVKVLTTQQAFHETTSLGRGRAVSLPLGGCGAPQ